MRSKLTSFKAVIDLVILIIIDVINFDEIMVVLILLLATSQLGVTFIYYYFYLKTFYTVLGEVC